MQKNEIIVELRTVRDGGEITDRICTMMQHSIGLDHAKPYHRHGKAFYSPYRNYYDAGGTDIPYWDALVDVGLAYKGRTYHLTDEGFSWLGERIGVTIHPVDE